MLREIWKMFKLNIRLAKEEIAAMSAMLALACISFWMMGPFFPIAILGLVAVVIAIYTLSKAIFRILADNEYGDVRILIKTLPCEDKSRKIASMLSASGVLFVSFVGLEVNLLGGYMGLHSYRLSGFEGFLKWSYCWGGLNVSRGQIWAMLPVKILFFMLLSLCTAAVYEYAVTRAHSTKARRKNRGRISEDYNSYAGELWLPPLVLWVFARALPIYISSETFSFFFPAVQAAMAAAVFATVMVLLKREEKVVAKPKTSTCNVAEGRTSRMNATGKAISKYKAYTELIGVGKPVNWQMALCLLPITVALRNSESLGIAVVSLLFLTLTLLAELAQMWNTAILFDENATFYYSFPLSTEEVVRAHTKIGCKIMLPASLLLCGCVSISALFPEGEKTAADVIERLLGQTGGGFEMCLLCGMWVLIIAAMHPAFSGWALFNSAFASRWRDPVTHKSGRLAGGLILVFEVAIHVAILAAATPFTYVNPLVGSLIILLLLGAECYGVYRLNVAEFRDRYSV